MARVPKAGVELVAKADGYTATLTKAREDAAKTAYAIVNMGGVGGKTGEILSQGLKRGTRDVVELADAFGIAGGKASKLLGEAADLVLTGLNPLSLAVAGIGIAATFLADDLGKTTEAARRQAEEIKHSTELQESFTKAMLAHRAAAAGVTVDRQREVESVGALLERVTSLTARYDELDRKRTSALEAVRQVRARRDDQALQGAENEVAGLAGQMEQLSRQIAEARMQAARVQGAGVIAALDDATAKRRSEEDASRKAVAAFVAETSARRALAEADTDLERALIQSRAEYSKLVEGIDPALTQLRAVAAATQKTREQQILLAAATKELADAEKRRAAIKGATAEDNTVANNAAAEAAIAEINAEYDATVKAIKAAKDRREERRAGIETTQREIEEFEDEKKRNAQDAQAAIADLELVGQDEQLRIIRLGAQQQIQEIDAHGAELVKRLKDRGQDETAVVAAIEAAKARIRAEASEEEALHGDDLLAGFAAQARIAAREIHGMGAEGKMVYEDLERGFGDVFASLATDSKSATDVARSALRGLLADLARAEASRLFRSVVSSVGGYFAGDAASMGGNTVTVPRSDGTEQIELAGGMGGAKSAMKGGGVTFNHTVHNYAGAEVEQTSRPNSTGGFDVDTIVKRAVAKDLAENGPIAKSLEGTYGVKRQGRKRQ